MFLAKICTAQPNWMPGPGRRWSHLVPLVPGRFRFANVRPEDLIQRVAIPVVWNHEPLDRVNDNVWGEVAIREEYRRGVLKCRRLFEQMPCITVFVVVVQLHGEMSGQFRDQLKEVRTSVEIPAFDFMFGCRRHGLSFRFSFYEMRLPGQHAAWGLRPQDLRMGRLHAVNPAYCLGLQHPHRPGPGGADCHRGGRIGP